VNGTLVQGWLYQDQLRPVAQLDGSGTNVVARFVYGSKPNVPDYMITNGGTYRILSDHLGSPRAVVDIASGNLIETINFDEFGNETDTLAVTLPTGYVRIPFGFAGGLYDPDTSLVRFGARDYDASVGRWTSKDPLRFEAAQDNLYGYVFNDPVNFKDQGGLLAGVDDAAEAAAAAAAAGAAAAYGLVCLLNPKACQAIGDKIANFCRDLSKPQDRRCDDQVGSGGCTGKKGQLTKRCTYACTDGTQCETYVSCQWSGDNPPCPASCF
jgi:RHS repeat-associated protein